MENALWYCFGCREKAMYVTETLRKNVKVTEGAIFDLVKSYCSNCGQFFEGLRGSPIENKEIR